MGDYGIPMARSAEVRRYECYKSPPYTQLTYRVVDDVTAMMIRSK